MHRCEIISSEALLQRLRRRAHPPRTQKRVRSSSGPRGVWRCQGNFQVHSGRPRIPRARDYICKAGTPDGASTHKISQRYPRKQWQESLAAQGQAHPARGLLKSGPPQTQKNVSKSVQKLIIAVFDKRLKAETYREGETNRGVPVPVSVWTNEQTYRETYRVSSVNAPFHIVKPLFRCSD
jgi:hypothetical protein